MKNEKLYKICYQIFESTKDSRKAYNLCMDLADNLIEDLDCYIKAVNFIGNLYYESLN